MAARPRTARRRWSETFKKCVVSEASQPGVTVPQIAHRKFGQQFGDQPGCCEDRKALASRVSKDRGTHEPAEHF